jgi:hypothetical protein
MAVESILRIARDYGTSGATRLLKTLLAAERVPIKHLEIRALALLLWDTEWRVKAEIKKLTEVISSKPAEEWLAIAAKIAQECGKDRWTCLAVAWSGALAKASVRP